MRGTIWLGGAHGFRRKKWRVRFRHDAIGGNKFGGLGHFGRVAIGDHASEGNARAKVQHLSRLVWIASEAMKNKSIAW